MSNNKRVRDVVVGPGSSLQRVCKRKKYKTEKDYSCYFFKCVFFFLSKKYYHAVRHVAVVDNAKVESRQKLTAATTRSNRSHLSSVTAVTNQNQLLTSLNNNNDSVHNSIHERNRRWHPVNVINSRLCSAFLTICTNVLMVLITTF